MKIIFGMLLLHTIKIVHLEEMVDTTIILRRTITLDCKYSGNGTITQLHWSKVNGSVEETICSVHKSYGKFISPKYMSRLSFVLENSSSDLSITMREASDADIGLYACYVVVYPTGILKKIISVQADDISHTVPTSYQTFRENSKITLNFPYTLMGDVKKVMVEKFADGKKDLVTYCEHPMNGRRLIIYGFDFINHSFVNCSDLQNITLIIHKAIFTTRGLYQCHFWLDVKNHTISVNVELQAIDVTPLGTFALICGVSILVIVVIFTAAALCVISASATHKHKQIKTFNPLPSSGRKYLTTILDPTFSRIVYFGCTRNLGQSRRTYKTKGDGNCYFRAISYILTGTEDNYSLLRANVIHHMKTDLSKKLQGYFNEDMNEYVNISGISCDGVWTTDAEIMATANLLSCDIVIHTKVGDTMDWLTYPANYNLKSTTEH
ncbi:CD226 antigen [Anomaloglossus baeobatrachus]